MKLTEERILRILIEEIYDLEGKPEAASAIFAAHEQEIDELQKAYSDALDECISRNIEGHRQMVRFREENALLKQSQKGFAKFVREQVDNYKVPQEDWERIRDMNWDQLYEYWKTINKKV